MDRGGRSGDHELSGTAEAGENPIGRFQALLAEARERESFDATACTLATATLDGAPSARTVLLKAVDESGFVFYTNLRSRKVRELAANPRAALCFYWPALGQQVRVEGPTDPVDEAEADEYFASRPRGSQLGAWASRQSEPLASREELSRSFTEAERRFAGRDVPRPDFWSGYRLLPQRLEFWAHRDDRLHERRVCVREGEAWRWGWLYP